MYSHAGTMGCARAGALANIGTAQKLSRCSPRCERRRIDIRRGRRLPDEPRELWPAPDGVEVETSLDCTAVGVTSIATASTHSVAMMSFIDIMAGVRGMLLEYFLTCSRRNTLQVTGDRLETAHIVREDLDPYYTIM